MNKSISYKSSQLYESAFLLATGSKMLSQETKGETVIFVFDRDTDLDKKLQGYVNNDSVQVRSFVSALDSLRQMIRSRTGERT